MTGAEITMAGGMRVGHVVVYLAPAEQASNGTRSHPAVVTRVWGPGRTPTVNLKVLPDCGEPFDATSVGHWTQGYLDADDRPCYSYREV